MDILYKPVCKDQGVLVMNLCVTEDRGITCRYILCRPVFKDRGVHSDIPCHYDFLFQNLHLLIHK